MDRKQLYQDGGMMVISHFPPTPVIYCFPRIRHNSDDFFRPTKEVAGHWDRFHLLTSRFRFGPLTVQLPVRTRRHARAGRGCPSAGCRCHPLGRGHRTVLNTEDLSLKQACFSNLWESLRHTVV